MQTKLTDAPIRSALLDIAAPAAVGSLFQILYNIVDSWYAAQISTEALAGLSLSFPVFFIFIAVSVGYASASTALLGQALGEKAFEKVRFLAGQALCFAAWMSLLILLLGLLSHRAVFQWLGAEGAFLEAASIYMQTLFYAAPVILLPGFLNAGLIAQGKTQVYRNVLICAFFANLLLNPWLIYGGFGVPAMGIRGIAVATVLSQAGAGLYLWWALKRSGVLGERIDLTMFKPRWRTQWLILCQGTPQLLNMLSIGAFFFIANSYVARFGAQAVAAYGIGLRIEQLILVPSIAVNQAALALVSNNLGAKLYDRVQETWHVAIRAGLLILGVGSVLLLLFARTLMEAFTQDAEVIAVGMGYLNIEAYTLLAYAFIHVNGGVLQGLKKPKAIMWLGVLRTFLLPLLILPWLIDYQGYGLTSIWWMVLVLSWLCGIILHWHTGRLVRQVGGEAIKSV